MNPGANNPIITIAHLRAEKLCVRGARVFAQRHGLDWPRLLRDGIPSDELEALGDALAQRLIERARTEAGNG